jgi:predicted permease
LPCCSFCAVRFAPPALDGPQYSSLFQGPPAGAPHRARHHPVYFGQAHGIGAVSAAAMIPLLNVVNVAVLSLYASGKPPDARAIALSILKNPFVLSSVGGVLWKFSGLALPGLGLQVLDMIGKGALGLALLAVGAGLRLDHAMAAKGPVILATILKLLVMPLFMAFWLMALGVTGQTFAVAMIAGAVPTGSGAYVLARRMGGDATLVANILTLQVICAALTIPLVVAFLA